jgi:GNAT superfamily N-acetyltransferase
VLNCSSPVDRKEELMPTLHRGPAVVIRPYRPADQPQLRALHDRTPPDGSPPSTGTQAWFPDLDHIPENYLAFLVAVEEADEGERLIGMVGITTAGSDVPASVLQGRERVLRLERLRVAPERQRQGIGARLTEAAITWSRDHGYHALVVETTPQQTGAIGLYRHMGFGEAGRSMIGPFELVWFDLPLHGA